MKKLFLFLFLATSLFVQTQEHSISTSQGKINVLDSQGSGPPVLLIHGNSASGQIFKKQFAALGKKHRLIAPDLPGHGKSDSARDSSTYSFPGYAKVLKEVVDTLGVTEDVTVVGWSLGGHIALELSLLVPTINGVLITGTPPIQLTREGLQKGFKPFEGLHLLGHSEKFTPDQAKLFMELGGFATSDSDAEFIIEDAIKTDGAARKHMFASIGNGVGNDETVIVKDMKKPLAIVAGQNDCGINNDYISSLSYGNLWKGKVHIIPNTGHAVFWENPDAFNKIVAAFLSCLHER